MASGCVTKLLLVWACLAVLPKFVLCYYSDFGFLGADNICLKHPKVTLNIPENSKPVPPPEQYSNGFYHIGSIGNGLFFITDGLDISLVLVGPDGIIAFDAPPTIGGNAANPNASVSYVDVVLSVPGVKKKDKIIAVVYSHAHLDHMGGAKSITDKFPAAKIVAHKRALQDMQTRKMEDPFQINGEVSRPPLPNVVFTKKLELSVGKKAYQKVYLYDAGNPHSQGGDIYIWFPGQETLMIVDVIFPGNSPFNLLAQTGDFPRYVALVKEVLQLFPFKTFVGGHLNRIGTRKDVSDTVAYINDIQLNAIKALKDPRPFAIFSKTRNALGAAHIYLDQACCLCAILTLDPATTPSKRDWISTLAAADINTITHCYAAIQAYRIDPGF
eukprot:TRINITY_DN6226_c1_g1_i1.p1 TRINITY_DN6226_c1_g1~~TRINITY_DN6226_c1_g1_i1.p1  ORF type:complete len:385 (+),score=57.31 TRINITY_DN6226_c1_g1_i1:95-1249(+)